MICSKFNVGWDRYGRLTMGEIRVLLEMIDEERRSYERRSG